PCHSRCQIFLPTIVLSRSKLRTFSREPFKFCGLGSLPRALAASWGLVPWSKFLMVNPER
ncbi:MAG: hypothetical protein LUP97_08335, partial [Methanoregula sp.]|nr:hypothetical protein [Methanoregula sp.]